MNYNLKSNDLLKENWVKVEFSPVFDECWEWFVDDYIEEDGKYSNYDREDYEEICNKNNTHIIYVNKESLYMVETLAENIKDELFDESLNFKWNVFDNEVNMMDENISIYDERSGWQEIQKNMTHIMAYVYDKENGWEEVQNNIKSMII